MKLNINGKIIEIDNDKIQKDGQIVESLDITSDLIIRTTEEEETFSSTIREEGRNAGASIGRKELLKKMGLHDEGDHKSDERAMEVLNNWKTEAINKAIADANVDPDKRIAGYEQDIDILRNTVKSKESEIENLNSKFNSYRNDQIKMNGYRSLIPDNTTLPTSQILTLMSSEIKTKVDDNGNLIAIDMNGEIKKDPTTAQPIAIKNVVSDWFNKNSYLLKGPQGGAGGEDSSSGTSGLTPTEFHKQMTEKGLKQSDPEYQKEMAEGIKNGIITT